MGCDEARSHGERAREFCNSMPKPAFSNDKRKSLICTVKAYDRKVIVF